MILCRVNGLAWLGLGIGIDIGIGIQLTIGILALDKAR